MTDVSELMDSWDLRDWMLRGLSLSCVSATRWWLWVHSRATDSTFEDFVIEKERLTHEGLVYVQRMVPEGYERVEGWSLTPAGIEAEKKIWNKGER